MTCDELRGRVHHEVGAELERALAQRCRERVVDHDNRAALLRRRDQSRQVEHVEQRIRRRLEPDQIGSVEGCDRLVDLRGIDLAQHERAIGVKLPREPDRAVVRGTGNDGHSPDWHERERRRYRRHARGIRQSRHRRSLELRNRFF